MIALESSVLVVAGSDSGAGAGIQADLKTCAAFGVHASTAITAITVQNTRGVRQVEVLPPSLVAAQMRAVLEDFSIAAVKLGMLGSAGVVSAVADLLDEYPHIPVILDPVLVSTSGASLLDAEGVALLRERLLPRALLVTPNLAEAALLGELSENEVQADLDRAAVSIMRLGVGAVLIKGGHINTAKADDVLFYQGRRVRFSSSRVITSNLHGTGCTLASAIAAGLARGEPLVAAVERAKGYLTQALIAGASRPLGRGCGPMDHGVVVDGKNKRSGGVDSAT